MRKRVHKSDGDVTVPIERVGWGETPLFLVAMKSLGRTIRHHREQQELTLEQASEKMGLDYRHLAKIETGSLNPTAFTLYRVALGLGVSLEALISGKGVRASTRRG